MGLTVRSVLNELFLTCSKYINLQEYISVQLIALFFIHT
jgi:hypothetical protein